MENKAKVSLIEEKIKLWLPVIIWSLVIFLLSSRPANPVSQIFWKDFIMKKTAHIIEYFIFTTLTYRALKESGVNRKTAAVSSILTCFVYGISDEFHQSFVSGRESRLRDVIIDTTGGIIAIYSLLNILPKMPIKIKNIAKRLQLI